MDATVVVLVVDVIGGGAVVVVCSVVLIWVAGVAQPASPIEPAISATPVAKWKCDLLLVVFCFLEIRAWLARDQRVVVVSFDLCVSVVTPNGDTVVPLELDLLISVTTPLTPDDRCVLVETEESDGIGAIGATVVCVVVVLEDELCATAMPLSRDTAIVVAERILNMPDSPKVFLGRCGVARLIVW